MGSREDISKPNMNICIGHLSRKRLLPVQPCFLCFSSSLLASLCPRSYFQGGLPQCRAAHGELCDRSGCSSSHGPHDSELIRGAVHCVKAQAPGPGPRAPGPGPGLGAQGPWPGARPTLINSSHFDSSHDAANAGAPDLQLVFTSAIRALDVALARLRRVHGFNLVVVLF